MKKLFILITAALVLPCFADELDKSVLKPEWRDMVLDAVNWDHPGLEKAKKLYLAKDKMGASAEFVKYLRAKKQPDVLLARLANPAAGKAEQGLNYIWQYGCCSSGRADVFHF